MINVSKPFLPPLEVYNDYLKSIWSNNWLTNRGPLVNKLENEISALFNLDNCLFTSNGTIALQIAIKSLGLTKEIITTPFSYVATSSSILWENCSLKFCDINEQTLNLDVDLLEDLITPNTEAVLATHVFGNPCDVLRLEEICKKHDIKLIFDAAHCFNTSYSGRPVIKYGDISTLSFHATKLFHTTEGGAIICNSQELAEDTFLRHNFGHTSPTSFGNVGINGKNSEFHAAMGLSNLIYIAEILETRKNQWEYYRNKLETTDFKYQKLTDIKGYNYSYFPVIFRDEGTLMKYMTSLNNHYIYPRRYFYPSLNLVTCLDSGQNCPISEGIASRILCLPLYHTLKKDEQDLIVNLLSK